MMGTVEERRKALFLRTESGPVTGELARRLDRLAWRLEVLRPLNHDPEAYFIERDAIRRELEKIARELSPRRAAAEVERGRFSPGDISVAGRRVRVELRHEQRPRRDPGKRAG